MEESKTGPPLEDKPAAAKPTGHDVKADLTTIRMELAEIRAAFFNLANEMKQMHATQKAQHQDFNEGIVACQQAFYRCKSGYERVAEAYENIENGIDSAAGLISDRWTY